MLIQLINQSLLLPPPSKRLRLFILVSVILLMLLFVAGSNAYSCYSSTTCPCPDC